MYRRAYIFLIVATLCWGGNAVAGKLAIGHISPMLLTFWRWAFATVIIFAISIPDLRRDWPVIRSNLPLLAFLGLVGYVVFNAALYTAVNYTTAINVTVDPSILGGLIVKVGSRQIDTSLRTKLSSLKLALKEVG